VVKQRRPWLIVVLVVVALIVISVVVLAAIYGLGQPAGGVLIR
jgi:hypothetical protein